MEFIYGLVAILIAWTWVDYFRLIDVYEKEKLKYFIIIFFLGWASVLIVLWINHILSQFVVFELNGYFINDFLYCTFGIGAIEEFAKLIPFLIIYTFIKKEFNEPVDYLIFISISALGFSAAENLLYFRSYGPSIITSRAILSTISHMFDTSLIAYGIILYIYRSRKFSIIIGYFLLASLSHGIYDFLLMHEPLASYGWSLMLIYFLLTISLYATILNNALNNSRFFTYKKVVNSKKVRSHLFLYYFLIFCIQIFLMKYVFETNMSWEEILYLFIFIAVIISITISRLSRFTLIKGRWDKLKLIMPFRVFGGKKYYQVEPLIRFAIKGDSRNEVKMNTYFNEYFYLTPMKDKSEYMSGRMLAYIENKVLLSNNITLFVIRLYEGDENSPYTQLLLRPKAIGANRFKKDLPIVGILKSDHIPSDGNSELPIKGISFIEWAYASPINKIET